jgi:hypothetical protein
MSTDTLDRPARLLLESMGLNGDPSASDRKLVAKIMVAECEREITELEIETMAKAMFNSRAATTLGYWQAQPQHVRGYYRDLAKIAIQAHREFLKEYVYGAAE